MFVRTPVLVGDPATYYSRGHDAGRRRRSPLRARARASLRARSAWRSRGFPRLPSVPLRCRTGDPLPHDRTRFAHSPPALGEGQKSMRASTSAQSRKDGPMNFASFPTGLPDYDYSMQGAAIASSLIERERTCISERASRLVEQDRDPFRRRDGRHGGGARVRRVPHQPRPDWSGIGTGESMSG